MLERDLRDATQGIHVVGRNADQGVHRHERFFRAAGARESVDVANEDARRILLVQAVRPLGDDFVVLRRFDVALALESQIAEHHQCFHVRGIEADGTLGGVFGTLVVLEPFASQRRHFAEQLGLRAVAVGFLHLALEELDGGVHVPARQVGFAKSGCGRHVARVRVQRQLVLFDGAVAIAAGFEELGGAQVLLGLGFLAGRLFRQLLDRREGGVGVARRLPDVGERFERAGVLGIDLEGLLVRPSSLAPESRSAPTGLDREPASSSSCRAASLTSLRCRS